MVATRLQGLNVTGAIVPFTDKDNYATHISKYGFGGWHEAATLAERDAIPMERRTKGMAVFVQEDKKLYEEYQEVRPYTHRACHTRR